MVWAERKDLQVELDIILEWSGYGVGSVARVVLVGQSPKLFGRGPVACAK